MNVGEQDGVQIFHGKAKLLELQAKSFQRGAWAGVDYRVMALGREQCGGDGVRTADPHCVEDVDSVHGGSPNLRQMQGIVKDLGWRC